MTKFLKIPHFIFSFNNVIFVSVDSCAVVQTLNKQRENELL